MARGRPDGPAVDGIEDRRDLREFAAEKPSWSTPEGQGRGLRWRTASTTHGCRADVGISMGTGTDVDGLEPRTLVKATCGHLWPASSPPQPWEHETEPGFAFLYTPSNPIAAAF